MSKKNAGLRQARMVGNNANHDDLGPTKSGPLAAVFSIFGLIVLGQSSVFGQTAADLSNVADLRTAAYEECHKRSTEMLYNEFPTCQPGAARLHSPSSTAVCPFRGGDRLTEIMRRSGECMREKGY